MRMSRTRSAAARIRDRVSLAANGRSVVLICLTALVTSVATAGAAATLIDGGDVKNSSLTGADIKKRSVPLGDLSRNTQSMIKKGLASPTGLPGQNVSGGQGERGGNGAKGDKGENGAQYVGPNWGIVDRNTIGSPSITLRAGPISGTGSGAFAPPFGAGSLSFLVGDENAANPPKQEKAVFGNQVDFAGDLVSNLTAVGFRVWQSGENNGKGNPNMPSIAFEIDPNITGNPSNFSTLVFNPATNPTANQWTGYIDATDGAQGNWFLTGTAGNNGPSGTPPGTGCSIATPCTFAEMQTKLDDSATILTAQVQKGRDFAWQGAIDGLRINNEVFDFEQFGVVVRAP